MKDRNILLFKLIMFISAIGNGIFLSFINLHYEQVVGLTLVVRSKSLNEVGMQMINETVLE